MTTIKPDAGRMRLIEHKLNKLQTKIAKLSTRLMVGIILFILTIAWLSQYKIIINLIIVSVPVVLIYGLLFVKWIKQYDRLMKEYRILERKYLIEKSRRELLGSLDEEFLSFRRN